VIFWHRFEETFGENSKTVKVVRKVPVEANRFLSNKEHDTVCAITHSPYYVVRGTNETTREERGMQWCTVVDKHAVAGLSGAVFCQEQPISP